MDPLTAKAIMVIATITSSGVAQTQSEVSMATCIAAQQAKTIAVVDGVEYRSGTIPNVWYARQVTCVPVK